MNTSIELRDGVAVIAPKGSLTVKQVDEFRSEVETWLKAEPEVKDSVLDLGDVDLIDSSGLGGILALFTQARDRGGKLSLAAMSRKVRLLFEITKAHEVFEIFDTVDDAVAAAGSS